MCPTYIKKQIDAMVKKNNDKINPDNGVQCKKRSYSNKCLPLAPTGNKTLFSLAMSRKFHSRNIQIWQVLDGHWSCAHIL